jgi:hypothetical protein
MSADAGPSPHESEPFHVLMFYSFLSGFADVLLDESQEREATDRYREVSSVKSAEFARSDFAESELLIASALESYISDGVYLLDGDEPRSWVSSVIQDPIVMENLLRIGEALSAARSAAWLGSDADRSRQAFVDWSNSGNPPDLSTRGAMKKVDEEVFQRGRPVMERIRRLGSEPPGGAWWSAPAGVGLPYTTRKLQAVVPAELICRDDSLGESRACAWDVDVSAGARVAEVHDLPDWQQLVAAYPRLVSDSQRQEWRQRFRWPGPWFLPDWGKLAQHWDGVHLSANGYLRCKGRVAPVEDGRTVLAGWDPDATYWLRDSIVLAGSAAEFWVRDLAGEGRWRRTTSLTSDDE